MTEVYATPQPSAVGRAAAMQAAHGSESMLSVRQIEKVYGNRDSICLLYTSDAADE